MGREERESRGRLGGAGIGLVGAARREVLDFRGERITEGTALVLSTKAIPPIFVVDQILPVTDLTGQLPPGLTMVDVYMTAQVRFRVVRGGQPNLEFIVIGQQAPQPSAGQTEGASGAESPTHD